MNRSEAWENNVKPVMDDNTRIIQIAKQVMMNHARGFANMDEKIVFKAFKVARQFVFEENLLKQEIQDAWKEHNERAFDDDASRR
jgi:hypothetical protein